MREWLTVIIGLLILAVVLDGVRRMRLARRNKLRMSPRMSGGGEGGPDTFASELPNGGARVVKTRKPNDARVSSSEASRVPEQVALNLDEHVPTLMEVEQEESSGSARNDTRQAKQPKRVEPYLTAEELDEDHPDVILGLVPSGDDSIDFEPGADADDYPEEPAVENQTDVDTSGGELTEPEEVLVINVMAAQGERLHGDMLLDTVLEQGMRFGDMNIFHHHEKPNGSGALLYSMANMVVPGTFDLDTMRDFSTPGVSLFLALPSQADSSKAFEAMLQTARAIAANLGSELKDENRSVMTAQTIEHYRSRIKEFERKQLSRASMTKAPL